MNLLKSFTKQRQLWIPLFMVVIIGSFTNFIVSGLLLTLILLTAKQSVKPELFFVFFLMTFFLGDNFYGPLNYNQNLRFVILGLTLIYLSKDNVFFNKSASKVLPFSLIAMFVAIFFSPVGTASILRAVSYWLVALCVFGLIKKNLSSNKDINTLIILIITLYYSVTLFFKFIPVLDVIHTDGRFKGMMGNPNGLGLLSIFSYSIIDFYKNTNRTIFEKSFFKRLKLLVLIIILFTGSRTALFSILIYEIISRSSKNIVLMLLMLGCSLLIYWLIETIGFGAIVYSLGLNDFIRVDTLGNASGRTDVWEVAWDEIKSSPWLGKGILYDRYFIINYARQTFGDTWDRQWNGIWSSYLSLLLDVGIIGVLAYVSFVYKMLKKAKYKSLAIGFIAMSAFSGITESWMAASMNAFTPMFFLYWAIQGQLKAEVEEI